MTTLAGLDYRRLGGSPWHREIIRLRLNYRHADGSVERQSLLEEVQCFWYAHHRVYAYMCAPLRGRNLESEGRQFPLAAFLLASIIRLHFVVVVSELTE